MNERRPTRGFDAVETWVFDLDNTLYPHHLNLWQQVDARIRDYIVGFLNVTHDEALRVQKDYYRRYGTTMRGLMEEHGLDPDKFLAVVHEIDHSPLNPDPALGAAIASLSGRKLILTNGTRRHAEAVMRRLEIEQHFTCSTLPRPISSPSRGRRSTTDFLSATASIRRKRRYSRISPATSKYRTRSA